MLENESHGSDIHDRDLPLVTTIRTIPSRSYRTKRDRFSGYSRNRSSAWNGDSLRVGHGWECKEDGKRKVGKKGNEKVSSWYRCSRLKVIFAALRRLLP